MYPHEEKHLWSGVVEGFWARVYDGKGLYNAMMCCELLRKLFVQVVALLITLTNNQCYEPLKPFTASKMGELVMAQG